MDENNQYGNATTKLLENISIDDKIGHLFVVDIKFNKEAANEKAPLFNEIYTPKFEKKKVVKPFERSVLQLMSVMVKNKKDLLNTFKFNEKTHSTMNKKFFLPLHVEDLHFLIKRTGWLIKKIYGHCIFEQSMFKKHFVIMNQVSRQKATDKVEKNFHKLMNNSNFCKDCCNHIENCNFKSIYDDIEEISCIQKYASLYFNNDYKDFACPKAIKEQIEHEFNSEIMKISPNDSCTEAKKILYQSKTRF